MLKSYETVYGHGRIEWLGANPNLRQAGVIAVFPDAALVKKFGPLPGQKNG